MKGPRRPAGWTAPGPRPAGDRGREELRPADGEELSFLTGDFRLFQPVRGHRWSMDDLVTAWVAAEAMGERPPARTLDLGCGIGSVLLMTAWRFPEARAVGIEAQPASAAMARRSIAWNGVEARVEVRDGDLRDAGARFAGEAPFDLVTGTPPYFREGEGRISEVAQRAACRFEERGGVEAYASAAAPRLADGGTFVLCAGAFQAPRVRDGCAAAGLDVRDWLDVVPRAGKAPLVAVFTCGRAAGAPAFPDAPRTLVVRDAAGAFTPAFLAVRAAMGFPPAP